MKYQDVLAGIKSRLGEVNRSVAAWVAAPYTEEIIRAVEQVVEQGFIARVVFVGERAKIPRLPSHFEHVEHASAEEIAQYAAQSSTEVVSGLVVKGNISSSTLLKAVLKGTGGKAIASHAYIIQSPSFPERAILVSDAGVNIHPDLHTKTQILHNTLDIARKVGVVSPRVAVLSAVENVNPLMPCTVDAASLTVMAQRGAFGDAHVDGPMAIDAAMMPSSAATKNLHGEVAGRADILLLDDIEAANSTAKALIGSVGEATGVIVGAGKIIAFPSRGDSEKTRAHSLLLAAFLSTW